MQSDYVHHDKYIFAADKNKSKMRYVSVSITLNWQTSTSTAIRELTSTKGSQFEEKAGVIQHKLYH